MAEGEAGMEETDVHRAKPAPGDLEIGAGARIARLLALAHHFQHLLDTRVVASQTELARLAKFSTARCTQIMNLLVLAPDIQEEILFLDPVCKGRAAVTEKKLKPVLATLVWTEQRRRWVEIKRRQL